MYIVSGLDIACENANEEQIKSSIDILKKDAYTIFYLKLRNCLLRKLPDYIFLGLEVIHLTIIRSNVSVIDRASLSALAGNLDMLDLANNNIPEVSFILFK